MPKIWVNTPEKQAYAHDYYVTHREECKKRVREYYRKKRKAKYKENWKINRERIIKYQMKYYWKNRSKILFKMRAAYRRRKKENAVNL